MRKICEIKFSKTEKTSNLEVAMLKLHKCYHVMMFNKMQLKSSLWLKLWQPVKLLKSLNDRLSHVLLKFKEP